MSAVILVSSPVEGIRGLHARMRQSGDIDGQPHQLARRAVAHSRPCERLDGGLRRAPSTAAPSTKRSLLSSGTRTTTTGSSRERVNGDIHRASSSSSQARASDERAMGILSTARDCRPRGQQR
ncbi:hypothetical protein Dimus_032883 [Dionaea muscipula]